MTYKGTKGGSDLGGETQLQKGTKIQNLVQAKRQSLSIFTEKMLDNKSVFYWSFPNYIIYITQFKKIDWTWIF